MVFNHCTTALRGTTEARIYPASVRVPLPDLSLRQPVRGLPSGGLALDAVRSPRERSRATLTAEVHVFSAEVELGSERIVCAAAKLEIVDRRRPAERKRAAMMDLEAERLPAPLATGVAVRATRAIAVVHLPTHPRGHVTSLGSGVRAFAYGA